MKEPSKYELSGPLQDWLDTLPQTVPLRATTDSPMIDGERLGYWITESHLPSNSMAVAMLWLRIGVIDPSHDIVQKGSTSLASYLHGVVHRLEGDYSNAKYWFRQVRDSFLLQQISKSMENRLNDEAIAAKAAHLGIMQADNYQPSELVAAIEQLNQQSIQNPEDVQALQRISWIEWTTLWESNL